MNNEIPSICQVGALYRMHSGKLYSNFTTYPMCQENDYIMIVAAEWSEDIDYNGRLYPKAWLEIQFLSARTERMETMSLRLIHWEKNWSRIIL